MFGQIPNFIINNHQLFLFILVMSVFLSVYSPLASFVLNWGRFGYEPLPPASASLNVPIEEAFKTLYAGINYVLIAAVIISFISSTSFPAMYDVPRFVLSVVIGFILVGFYMFIFSFTLPVTFSIVNNFPMDMLDLISYPFLDPVSPLRFFLDNAITIFFLNIIIAVGATFLRIKPV